MVFWFFQYNFLNVIDSVIKHIGTCIIIIIKYSKLKIILNVSDYLSKLKFVAFPCFKQNSTVQGATDESWIIFMNRR